MTSLTLRRATIFGTPVALGTLAAIHPTMPEHNLGIWNLIHTLQIPLVALLGISVILMLRHGMIARRAAVAFPPSMPLIGAPAMLAFLSGTFVVEMSSRPAAVAARPVSAEPAR